MAFLLIYSELPTREELDAFTKYGMTSTALAAVDKVIPEPPAKTPEEIAAEEEAARKKKEEEVVIDNCGNHSRYKKSCPSCKQIVGGM